jgi:hypothetical protein
LTHTRCSSVAFSQSDSPSDWRARRDMSRADATARSEGFTPSLRTRKGVRAAGDRSEFFMRDRQARGFRHDPGPLGVRQAEQFWEGDPCPPTPSSS